MAVRAAEAAVTKYIVKTDFITLGIETSCDDTALALMRGEREIIGDVVSSQITDHAPFGGVVPELASRKHQEVLIPLLSALMSSSGVRPGDIDLIAVTSGPGLMGSLLVGVMAAKALSQGWNVPLIGVNHLEGHLFAGIVANPSLRPPFLCLIVSGGHTEIVLAKDFGDYLLLGETRDDAAGEAYDKAAKLLGMPYPGGPVIERAALGGDPNAYRFPVALKSSQIVEFSFSGVKTSLRTTIQKLKNLCADDSELPIADICASYQRAITETLLVKTELAAKITGVRRITISGGVAANTALRDELAAAGEKKGWEVFLPPRSYCTDNAVMIASAGYSSYMRGSRSDLSLTPNPSWSIWKGRPARTT
ncbi:MAG: tRNA (adenosine(37)-N6)-threonylcarbamoyltransferase complex transferase subunit TsaD [Synergistaceae bacterium]|nr:tRNA (adenosine(37)-N6)-threonylcarbamoyltransferase complex transferase subunit TsaD [Synergistaceae bacterium]